MKYLEKPELCTKEIVLDCANSYQDSTRDGLKNKLIRAAEYIESEEKRYHDALSKNNFAYFKPHDRVNGDITTEDMCNVYNTKFVSVSKIRNKYYDKLMATATTGKCPICGIGQVSNLDHYLAKSIYPVYAIAPSNLTPICRDCNYTKRDTTGSSSCAPLHPYYDKIDSIIWLRATLTIANGSFAAKYDVDPNVALSNPWLYTRLVQHMELYALAKAYSIQAATEISENSAMWRKKLAEWGTDEFRSYLSDCLESKECSQRNTWNTALLRALISNISILMYLEE